MRIYVDIAHPAYFHALRNFIEIMTQHGHDFFVSAKDKEDTAALLDHHKIRYYNRGRAADSVVGKCFNIIKNDFKLYRRIRRFSPDIVFSFSSPIAAHLAFLLRKPCITLEDTECAGVVQRSYIPFSSALLTPSCFEKKLGNKQLFFNGYKEIAYLHPKYFNPSNDVNQLLGISSERYAIVRFVSHNALHDYGEKGIAEDFKIKLVEKLSTFLKVFISSETELSAQLEPYRLSIPAWEMHSVIAGAELLIGESATMAAEAAVLGVPAIFIDNQGRGYTNELEKKYNLVYNFNLSKEGLEMALSKAIELIQLVNAKEVFQGYRQKLIEEKIDVTAFLVWFIETYPMSFKTMKENPEYQNRFK